MRPPAFWDRPRPDWRARALTPLAAIYGAVARRRFDRPPRGDAGIPVVCVGSPTVGGAGKTPAAIHVAGRLAALGRRPVFLSRGYGARVAAPRPVDPEHDDARDVGDEPLLLARHAPCVVSPDRLAGAARCRSLGEAIVMDDGFQNPSLAKDLSILVVDGRAGVGNGLCLPAGPLRLDLDVQLGRCGAVAVVGEGAAGARVAEAAAAAGVPVLAARLVADADAAAAVTGVRVLAFAGIGRPAKFFATLAEIGADVVETAAYPDHHRYLESDAADLLRRAEAHGAVPVTTEKDAARLAGAAGPACARLASAAAVLPVALVLDAPGARALDGLLADALAARGVR